jgi:hypothetical protein
MPCGKRGNASVPIYSLDSAEYRERVYCNNRVADQNFPPDELLFRRFPRNSLINGWPVPLNLPIEDTSGISVNRARYSLPQDVLDPDCCHGKYRIDMVVLEFAVGDLPKKVAAHDREFAFVPKHVPLECCYAHSEIWCNPQGDIDQPCERPSKTIRDLFRAELLSKIVSMGRTPREFAVASADTPKTQSD